MTPALDSSGQERGSELQMNVSPPSLSDSKMVGPKGNACRHVRSPRYPVPVRWRRLSRVRCDPWQRRHRAQSGAGLGALSPASTAARRGRPRRRAGRRTLRTAPRSSEPAERSVRACPRRHLGAARSVPRQRRSCVQSGGDAIPRYTNTHRRPDLTDRGPKDPRGRAKEKGQDPARHAIAPLRLLPAVDPVQLRHGRDQMQRPQTRKPATRVQSM
jgi:hypothetical protein